MCLCIFSCVTDGTSTAGYAADSQSTITGDTVSIGNPKSDFTEKETEAWIKSLAVRAAQQEAEDANFECSSTLSRLTRQNILALDLMLGDNNQKKKADEESSIYSVDQEGFYTSFHNDSGLRKSTNTLVDEDYSPSKDSASVCSVESVIHVRQLSNTSDKFAGIKKGNQTKVLSKVTPPTPPLRTSSNLSTVSDNNKSVCTPELHSSSSQDSCVSSDAEAVFTRVQNKTHLSTTGFPSLVALSTSDDESSPEVKTEKISFQRQNKTGISFSNSDLGLSNLTCASQFSQDSSSESGSYFDSYNSSNLSLKHSKSVLECTDQEYNKLVPGISRPSKAEAGYQSWPRAHKNQTGILKSPAKQFAVTRPQKTLNFAPVVNLFKEGTQGSVQLPLPSPSNSSCSDSSFLPSSGLSSFQTPSEAEQSYNLSVPVNNSVQEAKQNLPLKYQSVITVTPRSRSRSGERKNSNTGREKSGRPVAYSNPSKPTAHSTPQILSGKGLTPTLHAVSPVMAPGRQNSNSSISSYDSTYIDMRSLKSSGSSSSLASSECLSFNDNNSTYMTMASPNSSPNLSNMEFSLSSTPSGSVDSLLDLRKTPTNELEDETYVNGSIPYQSHSGHGSSNGMNGHAETVPIVTQSSSRNYYQENGEQAMSSFTKPNNGHYTPGRQSLDSSAGDLTHVTPMAFNSPMGYGQNSGKTTPNGSMSRDRQPGRKSRADTRKEPSYRSTTATNRRSLPSDMSGANFQTKSVPLNDSRPSTKSNQSLNSVSSSKSLGYNSVLVSNSGYNSGQYSANNHRQHTGYAADNQYAGDQRTDSYRVAMGSNPRTTSYRNAMHPSKSCPFLPPAKHSGPYRVAVDMSPNRAMGHVEDDALSRADSYRIAVRNTHGLVSADMMNRNTSYRFAVDDDVPVINAKLDALGMHTGPIMSGRDARRMGITDVDQAKDIKVKPTTDTKMKPTMKHSASAPVVRMRHPVQAKQPAPKDTKSNDRSQNSTSGGRIRKVTKQDVDPIEIVQTVDTHSDSKKSSKNNPNRSSTYIQFDPIFEDVDDFNMPNEADYSKHLSSTSKSKLSLINGTVKDANANNVKPTMSSSRKSSGVEIEDNWRFSQV